jgi:hypothetical protein
LFDWSFIVGVKDAPLGWLIVWILFYSMLFYVLFESTLLIDIL